MSDREPLIGALRKDIEFINGDTPMLFDKNADSYYKITDRIAEILSYCTRVMPISEFREKLSQNGIVATDEELVKLSIFMFQNSLVEPEYRRIENSEQGKRTNTSLLMGLATSVLFFRLPPWRPERFFEIASPILSPLASRVVIWPLLLIALSGYGLMLTNLKSVEELFVATLSWGGLVKYFGAILFLKLIHEAAHSIAAMHFRCRIRGIGVGFMLFYPRLYTDVTDSWRLPRRERLLIDGAGLIIELIMGGFAALLWWYLPPGVWRSTMFYIFTVSTISTLMVNGNALIRYDGYYILCDLLNIENLLSRSNDYIKRSWRWYFLRLGAKPEGEHRVLLTLFGIGAFLYRLFLYTSIILVIYVKFFKTLAIIMLLLEIYAIFIYPLYHEFKIIRVLSKRSASRAGVFFVILAVAIVGGIFFVPWQWSFALPAIVVPVEREDVVVQESGYLLTQYPRNELRVGAGDKLLELTSPPLELGIERLSGILSFDKLQLQYQETDEEFFINTQITQARIKSTLVSLAELIRRRAELSIVAKKDGVFVPTLEDVTAGAFFQKGVKVGEVVSQELKLYAYATDEEIGLLEVGQDATAYLSDEITGYKVQIAKLDLIAVNLEHSPLLESVGGPIADQYSKENFKIQTSAQQLYKIELKFLDLYPNRAGRLAKLKIYKREQLYKKVVNFGLYILRREL